MMGGWFFVFMVLHTLSLSSVCSLTHQFCNSPLRITPRNIAHTFNRVAGSVDPAESGAALGSDGHFGLSVPDIKIRIEGLPNADLCEQYVFKVMLLLLPTSE